VSAGAAGAPPAAAIATLGVVQDHSGGAIRPQLHQPFSWQCTSTDMISLA